MKTLKVMSIIGLSLLGIYWLVAFFYTENDWAEVGNGWGVIIAIYFTAYAIVGLVQAKKHGIKLLN